MPTLKIDNQTVEVAPGQTVLQAARKLGIDIPALCYLDGCKPNTSCLACVVKVAGRNGLVPSCATVATDGMVVESETPEVKLARKTALELLLGDHAGDCISPCQNACPAHMDISQMIRQIASGALGEALVTVKRDIPLPAILGRICPAPCEPGCRRAAAGGPVAICKLKQFVADVDLAGVQRYLPPCAPATGQAVAVVGAGPAGLSAAYYLLQQGHAVTLLDDHEEPGGALRYHVEAARLPREVLDGEVGVVRAMGAQFRMGAALGRDVGLDELRRDFAAVVLATGGFDKALAERMGLQPGARGVHVEKDTHQTSIAGVFAAGGAIRPSKIAIRSVAEGKMAAHCVDQFLTGRPVRIDESLYTTRLPKLSPQDYQTFLTRAGSADGRTELQGEVAGGTPAPPEKSFTAEQALREALRCLHCDCAAAEDCKLRRYGSAYDADQRRFQGPIARPVTLRIEHPCVAYEPGKCISCGLCVQVAQRHGEPLGLTFIGRGFNVCIGVPFNESMSEGLRRAAAECAAACPTGALVLRADAKR